MTVQGTEVCHEQSTHPVEPFFSLGSVEDSLDFLFVSRLCSFRKRRKQTDLHAVLNKKEKQKRG